MIRFISFLFNREYEPCKGCEILKQQLEVVNAEKKELTNTLVTLILPKPQIPQEAREMSPAIPHVGVWSKRRAELERIDAAQALKNNKLIGRPNPQATVTTNNISQLEQELGIEEESKGE